MASWSRLLVSASVLEDAARVWDIASRQVIREVKQKGNPCTAVPRYFHDYLHHSGAVLKMVSSGGLMLTLSRQEGSSRHGHKLPTPMIKPFKKQLHYSRKRSAEEGKKARSMTAFPVELRGIDPVRVQVTIILQWSLWIMDAMVYSTYRPRERLSSRKMALCEVSYCQRFHCEITYAFRNSLAKSLFPVHQVVKVNTFSVSDVSNGLIVCITPCNVLSPSLPHPPSSFRMHLFISLCMFCCFFAKSVYCVLVSHWSYVTCVSQTLLCALFNA